MVVHCPPACRRWLKKVVAKPWTPACRRWLKKVVAKPWREKRWKTLCPGVDTHTHTVFSLANKIESLPGPSIWGCLSRAPLHPLCFGMSIHLPGPGGSSVRGGEPHGGALPEVSQPGEPRGEEENTARTGKEVGQWVVHQRNTTLVNMDMYISHHISVFGGSIC